ncbi:conserved hypothetical protein [Prochlorococcus marinus str. MIT 9515]|uniref:Repeats containing protein n=1 Tax=Prochlorococcus marinus (strain MIT 9515) TaxID=167542 RepID=A2BUN5_PROM5|nr:DUF3769 domain-containing protein [Prochlorococcus marinus]ABM71496.1 conserved hypothetical protein [Prochlorococcus marinus str. MIT 9515]
MNIRNFIKAISLVSSLINFSSLGKTIELIDIETKNTFQTKTYYFDNSKETQEELLKKNNNNLIINSEVNINKIFRNNSPLLLVNSSITKKELEIQSQIQSEENNILNAEGNVLVTYKGNILKADSLIYDKTNKIIIANGNVSLNIGEQLFKMVSLKYDFNNRKGYLLDVKGLIKTDNLIDDLFSNFENSDAKKIEILKEIKKDKVRHTPKSIENWVLFTDRINISGNKWTSVKTTLTNDLLELKQVKIEVNALEAIARNEELKFKSSVNFLVLDEKINIPFWFGDRTLTKEIRYENRWNIGFDNVDKDGFFIGRKLNSINIFDDFILDLEPQFLIQRSLKGYTKSFVSQGDSITADKVKRDVTLKDYFALNSQIKGKINKWTLEIDQQNNSFDPEKFSDSIRFKANLSKDIYFLNSKWKKSFYGIYRDRVWNGSIGETEIYSAYGSKLEKQNSWVSNGISKTEILSLGLASFKGEALNSKNLVRSTKGNFFYLLDQKFPIIVDESTNEFIDSSYNYIPKPIKKGLSLNTKLELLYSFYDSGNNQQYVGFGAGPEFVFGDFKKNLSTIPKLAYYLFINKSGEVCLSLIKFLINLL